MKSKLKIAILCLFLSGFVSGFSSDVISPFNSLVLEKDSVDADNFSFIVTGHLHGSSTNMSGYPANTLLMNLDRLNNSESTFIIALGDVFMDVKNDRDNYQWSLFDRLKIPLFNAVGNHDLSGRCI